MDIGRAGVKNAQEILSLQKLAYRSEAEIYNDFTIPPMTQTLEGIKADFEKQVFLKAVGNERMIGSVRAQVREGTCFIGRLVVHPDLQDQGIGATLMREVERRFDQAGDTSYSPGIGVSEARICTRNWATSLLDASGYRRH